MVPELFFYLLSPPAIRHQRIAYLSVTLMSSNRPGTVVNRHIKPHKTELSRPHAAVHVTGIYFNCQWRLNPASVIIQFDFFMMVTLMANVCNLLPWSWRNAAGGWHVRTEESCVRHSALPKEIIHIHIKNTHIHTNTQLHVSSTSWQNSPSGLSPTASIYTRPLALNVDLSKDLLADDDDLKLGPHISWGRVCHPISPMKTCNLTCHRRWCIWLLYP